MAVFRDQSDLALTPHLWSTIVTKLDESRYLVVLACPESAASAWVNKEVSHWCDTRGTEQLLLVVTGGEIAWDEAGNDFTAGSTAVLPALRGRFSEEPLYHDLRWARDTPDLSLNLSRFRGAVALVASTIRGVAPDDLESEDVRLHRRARRLAQTAVAVVVVLALLASAAAIAAVRNAPRRPSGPRGHRPPGRPAPSTNRPARSTGPCSCRAAAGSTRTPAPTASARAACSSGATPASTPCCPHPPPPGR